MSKTDKTIEGTLQRIVFSNDTGFVIGAFTDKHNNKFTALGSMINPQVDLNYMFSGYWTEDHRYGEQFRFSSYEAIVPIDTSGIFKYIVRICKFVGSTVGNKIIDKYGDRTLVIMKTSPKQLAREISGITLDRALKIQTVLLENEKTEKIMVQLEKILDIPGMRKDIQGKLIKEYKSNAVAIVKENPYILTQFAGVGFPLADRVALNIGFARDSIERKKAVSIHCLKENMLSGSVWISKDNLIFAMQSLVQVSNIEDGINDLVESGVVVEDSSFYTFAYLAKAENYIAGILMTLRTQ